MKRETYFKIVLVLSVIMVIVNLLMIDFDSLTNMKINLSAYLGVISMSLISLSMFLSMKSNKN